MFTGALTAIVNPDAERLAYALPRAKKQIEPVYSDAGRELRGAPRHRPVDLEPIIVHPADARPTPAT